MRKRPFAASRWGGLLLVLSLTSCGRVGFHPLDELSSASQNAGGASGDTGTDGATNGLGGASGADASTSSGGNSGAGGAANGLGGTTNGSGGKSSAGGASGATSSGGSSNGGASNDGGPLADAGLPVCTSCPPPIGFALTDTTLTTLLGGPGGAPAPDMCPNDEVVIGVAGYTGVSSGVEFINRISLVCGRPTVTGSGPYIVTIPPTQDTPMRGVDGTTAFRVTCPTDQAMVGYDAKTGNYFMEMTPRCAPLVVSKGPTGYDLTTGTVTTLASIGASGTTAPPALCPPGQVIRGAPLRSGLVIDAFSAACAKASLTRAANAACDVNTDCASGVCNAGKCAASTCAPSAGCSCERFEGHDYALCTTKRAQAAAKSDCTAMGMRLAAVNSAVEDGWLRATKLGATDVFVGGDSLANSNEWRWADGTLFWQSGAAPAGVYTDWRGGEPSIAPGCVGIQLLQPWATFSCTATGPYICERY